MKLRVIGLCLLGGVSIAFGLYDLMIERDGNPVESFMPITIGVLVIALGLGMIGSPGGG